ncbi:hypothetical protein [Winogradskyella sp.]|uniref:hypothetical protein n=1 Tax=Winogradskyella sp. TaxID=1883156 RepID=UPI003BA8C5C3
MNNVEINSIIYNLISAVIWVTLTSLYFYFRNKFKRQDKFLSFLSIKKSAPLILCYGNTHNSVSYTSPILEELPSTSFEYGDTNAILEIYSKFSIWSNIKPNWYSDYKPYKNSNNDIIVSIGGPKWNKTTEYLIGDIGSPLYFSSSKKGLIEKRSSVNKETLYEYNCTTNENFSQISDFGCIICEKRDNGGLLMIISGYSTFGVLFAAEALTKIPNVTIKKVIKSLNNDKKFGLIIKGSIKLDNNGRVIGESKIELLDWIGERNFHESYNYSY